MKLVVAFGLTLCSLISSSELGLSLSSPERLIGGTVGLNASPSEIVTVGFCELVRRPKLYNNKVIRIQATAVVDHFENSFLFNSSCEKKRNYTHFRVENDVAMQSLDDVLGPFVKGKISRAEVTVVGRFFASKGRGYGHLNAYRFEILITKVEKANPADVSKNKSLKRIKLILRDY
jgi:hypothetical protein